MNNRETAAVLRRAAEVLRERGHCKGRFEDDESRVCLWGALAVASGTAVQSPYRLDPAFLNGEVMRATAIAIANRGVDERGYDEFPGADWNDEPKRTGTEVEKFLLQLADDAEVGAL